MLKHLSEINHKPMPLQSLADHHPVTTALGTVTGNRELKDMTSRKLCAHTQRGHIYSCKRFAAFLKRSPETATCEDIRLTKSARSRHIQDV